MRKQKNVLNSSLILGVLLYGNFAFAKPDALIKIDGTTPKFQSKGVSLNIAGRAIWDSYDINADFDELLGSSTRDINFKDTLFKRAIWSIDGKIGKNLKFKAEHEFEGDTKAAWTDAYFEYGLKNGSVFIGSNHQTNPMDGQNSSANTQLANRSLLTSAFSQSSRNMGVAIRKYGKNWGLTTGIYGASINQPMDRFFSSTRYFQTRATYAPINNKNEILHYGASIRMRNRADDALYSYNARPIMMSTGTQFLQTGNIAKNDTNLGAEIFYAKGAFSTQFEAQILNAQTLDGTLNFGGAYWEGAYYISGESRTYNVARGLTGFTKPKKPIGKGIGAIGIIGRLDYLDLQDGNLGKLNAPINAWKNRGGKEYGYTIGLNYHPYERIIIRTSYSDTRFKETRGEILQNGLLVANPIGNGKSKTFNIRTQIGF
jgi:phosphate-selective porin OprO and OprP